MSLEGALRPEDGASPASAPAPPHASFDVTLSLLRQFYSHVKPLQELFPPDFQLLREGDSDAFRELVEETMVASLAEEGVGELRVESLVGPDVGMRDILEQVHTRLFSQHARLVTKVKKSSGAYISATPKNVLALGYRPATGWNNDAVSSAAGAIPLVNVFANTTVSALRSSREWHTLLARIGPHPLLTLLSSSTTALFTPLANACLLQVSGTPVSELKPRYILDEEIRRKQKKPRKRINRAGKRKRRKKDTLHDDDDSTEEREATVEATPPPSPPPPTIRTPNQSPIKRIRTLGPSVSAPELLSPGRTLGAQSRALVFPATQAGDRTALRPTQSSTSLLGGGVKRRAELEMGVKLKRKKLETL
ncbi:hypothetical protein BCR35DRAFT_158799 [Leucosporidium creatinivorum]|uniref:Telomerase reverse transcriptase n=1 Tax=Leucosporidium creatinivorum TaxID=106004 RepID=A0A1Y2G014_9BASI|nr:hypothetical protein BCR35DRAFT_158799 [Leucosporidium creatinivorum]